MQLGETRAKQRSPRVRWAATPGELHSSLMAYLDIGCTPTSSRRSTKHQSTWWNAGLEDSSGGIEVSHSSPPTYAVAVMEGHLDHRRSPPRGPADRTRKHPVPAAAGIMTLGGAVSTAPRAERSQHGQEVRSASQACTSSMWLSRRPCPSSSKNQASTPGICAASH